MATISEAFLLLVDLAIKRGNSSIKGTVVTFEIDSTWAATFNGCADERDNVPPYHCSVSYNGWPAGILGPSSGCIAAGEGANEDTLIAALKAAGASVTYG